MFSLYEVAGALGASVPNDAKDLFFHRVSTDTRNLHRGDLFIALKGETFNGHDFLKEAMEKGAGGFILSEERRTAKPTLFVQDTAHALGRLGAMHRLIWRGEVLAVTGSFGKTTVKDMLRCILSNYGPTLATTGNLNNHLGVPMTLLQLDKSQKFAVIEVGADKPGEIDYGASLIKPNIAVITGVGQSHLSGFGDRESVAKEKAKLLRHLSADGVAIVPADSPYDELWRKEAAGRRIIRYGDNEAANADIKVADCQQRDRGLSFVMHTHTQSADVFMPILGKHNCCNATAALAAVLALGEKRFPLEDLSKTLRHYRLPPGRLQTHDLKGNSLLIDDSYNANPSSTLAAMQTLASCAGYKILVLGDMLELGSEEAAAHQRLGEKAVELKLDEVLTCGNLANLAVERLRSLNAEAILSKQFDSKSELIDYLLRADWDKTVCLVKGSRGSAMETVVRALLNQFGEKK